MNKELPLPSKLPPLVYGFISVCAGALTSLRVWFSRKETKWFEQNLDKIWSLRPKTTFANMFIRQVYRSQILVALETLLEVFFPGCITFEGLKEFKAQIESLEKDRQGQIVVTAHLGSWEFVGYLTSRVSQCKFYALAKPSKYRIATGLLDRMRKRMNILVLWTSGASAQKNMIKALKAGSWLGFVMDQKPMGRRGPQVKFWGQKTEFVGGPAQMAIKFKKPIVAVFCVRIGRLRYRIVTKKILDVGHECSDVGALTQTMADAIENVIKAYPEQWCWNYKRWRFNDRMSL